MDDDLNRTCNIHATRSECPDVFIIHVNGGYGLFVHDGGSSFVEIRYCPWCGAELSAIRDTGD
jgi:hypothetical protein